MKFFDDDFLKNILKQFILGAAFAFGFLTFGILAVTISGTINTFATGQVIKASDINTNFASIKATLENIPDWVKSGANASYPSGGITVNTSTQLNSATVTVNGKISSISLGTYCGISSITTGNMGGFTGAKALCVTACGNANAHMCSGHEMIVSLQMGLSIPSNVWFMAGISSDINGITGIQQDCLGWTSNSGSISGGVYTGLYLAHGLCNSGTTRAACCL